VIRRFSFSSAMQNVQLLAQSLSLIFSPIPGFIGIIFFITTVTVLIYSFRKQFCEATPLKQIGVVITTYLSGFLFLNDLNVDEADRFISSIVPLMMLIAFYLFELIYLQTKKHLQIVLMLLLCFWMTYPVYRSVKNVLQWHERSCAQRRS
jgi:uncharacterized membrane protein YfcA